MLRRLDHDQPGLAAIYRPGASPPEPDALRHLPGLGYALFPGDVPDARWSYRVRHPVLGTADVWADDATAPLADHLAGATTLTDEERARAEGAASAVLLRVPPVWGDVRRDRKTLLRLAAAVLGDEGVMVVDLGSRVAWSPAALAEELAHDADLDLEALYSVHAVAGGRTWLHTHGLDDLGGMDIDIVEAHPDFVAASSDPIRAIAATLLDQPAGEGFPDELRFGQPGGVARPVPLTSFLTTASAALRQARRDLGAGHAGRRVVLCEPAHAGFLGFLNARRDTPEPLALARRPPPDGFVVFVPSAATTLMAERARGTLRILQARMAEFSALQLTALVKLGYPTRDGGQEHLWFEAHGFTDTSVMATLENDPIDVDLRRGARAERPLDLLTDWALVTPAGWITPRSSLATRRLREQGHGPERGSAASLGGSATDLGIPESAGRA